MREHLGEEFAGTVSAVTSFGLFVLLDALYVEGLIHITELGGEYYRFDEVRQELRGERTGIRFATGTRVQIQVSRVDLDGRKIDFRLVQDSEEAKLVARALRDKSGDKPGAALAAPATAQEALDQVRRKDRDAKRDSKSSRSARAAHPVKAVRQAAKKEAVKPAGKAAGEARARKRR
jgi:ribonuclease R